MDKEYIVIGDDVIVSSTNGELQRYKYSSSFEEELVVANKIEKLEDSISNRTLQLREIMSAIDKTGKWKKVTMKGLYVFASLMIMMSTLILISLPPHSIIDLLPLILAVNIPIIAIPNVDKAFYEALVDDKITASGILHAIDALKSELTKSLEQQNELIKRSIKENNQKDELSSVIKIKKVPDCGEIDILDEKAYDQKTQELVLKRTLK